MLEAVHSRPLYLAREPDGLLDFTYRTLPSRLLNGVGRLDELGRELRSAGRTRALIVTSPSVAATNVISTAVASLGDLHTGTFSDATAHVPVAVIDRLVDLVRQAAPDVLVAVGGGSAIDTAKAAVFQINRGGPLDAHELAGARPTELRKPTAGTIDLIAVPSTFSAAEMTAGFSITSPKHRRKLNFSDLAVRPSLVIHDPLVVSTAPPSLLAASGMNCLAHAVERVGSHRTPPISRLLQLYALQLIFLRPEGLLPERWSGLSGRAAARGDGTPRVDRGTRA